MKQTDLVRWLDEYLKIDEVEDHSWNGLQVDSDSIGVQGKEEVKKIGFAVDSGIEVFEKAAKEDVDFLIVHHGMFWKSWNPSFVNAVKQRIEALNKSGMSLYCAHLPLDRHKEVGNNAQLLKIIGAEIVSEFDTEEVGKNISWIGKFSKPKTLNEIEKTLNEQLKTKCKVLPFGKKEISTVAVCSGGGGYTTHQKAYMADVDLYITGDAIEVYQWDKDAMFNVIFAGHYATETVGVKALAKVIHNELDIVVEFIDVPTGL